MVNRRQVPGQLELTDEVLDRLARALIPNLVAVSSLAKPAAPPRPRPAPAKLEHVLLAGPQPRRAEPTADQDLIRLYELEQQATDRLSATAARLELIRRQIHQREVSARNPRRRTA